MDMVSFRRHDDRIFLLISYCLWAAVTVRWITVFLEQRHPLLWLIAGILAVFAVLLGVQPALTKGEPWRVHLYLMVQTGLVFFATLLHFELDFFALLYVPICGQAVSLLPRRAGWMWVGILVATTSVALFIQFSSLEAVSFILLYAAALIFVAIFVTMTRRAIEMRQQSERLLGELQEAHEQLRQYANQAEELAVAKERNRLARDLHDAVAQTLYGLTLQTAAARRKLKAGAVEAAQTYLEQIQASARQSLQEMRLIIYELRPPVLEQDGLAAALQTRLNGVEGRSGLTVHMDLDPETLLSPAEELALFRIAQEALNNVTKHAAASILHVQLLQEPNKTVLEVSDNGVGFDPEKARDGAMGLQAMAERAEEIGGRLIIQSAPGAGATIRVEAPR